MIIFINRSINYPIHRLDDSIPRVFYRTNPKGWIDQSMFSKYFLESRVYQSDLHHCTKYIWVDNCITHNMISTLAAVLAQKHTTFKYLPLCAIHLCQSADTFLISYIKEAWTKQWEAKKSKLIQENVWQNNLQDDGQWLEKLTKLKKKKFLQLAADAIEDVNQLVDFDNMSFTKKSID